MVISFYIYYFFVAGSLFLLDHFANKKSPLLGGFKNHF